MHKNKIDKSNISNILNNNRIYLFLIIIGIVMPFLAPGFWGEGNIVPLLKTTILPIMVGIGFTYVMIGGNFDLSVGSTINVGACLALGQFNTFYEAFGGEAAGDGALIGAWVLAIGIAVGAGVLVGLINGLLVAKGQVHSFIVTIGMLTALSGFVYTYCNGNTISADSSALVDVIEKPFTDLPYLSVFTLRFVILIVVIVAFELLLQKARWGRDLFMVGSNKEAAWQAGINIQKKIIMTFVVSGFCAALAGALFAISMNAAVPNYGERGINPLMLVLASTIIGGTVMSGGSGSVVKTAVAVITIQALFNGLIMMGLGFDAQVLAAGVLLAVVVIFEAYSLYRQGLKKGFRASLAKEAEEMRLKLKNNN